MQRVIAELWDDDPKETFAAARRMFSSGADRHDIIHTLAETPAAQAARDLPSDELDGPRRSHVSGRPAGAAAGA